MLGIDLEHAQVSAVPLCDNVYIRREKFFIDNGRADMVPVYRVLSPKS